MALDAVAPFGCCVAFIALTGQLPVASCLRVCPNKGDGRQQADEAAAVPQVERCLHHGGCKCEFNVEATTTGQRKVETSERVARYGSGWGWAR